MLRAHSKTCTCFKPVKESLIYYAPQLQKFKRLNQQQKKELFEQSDRCFIRFVGECCEALLTDAFELPKESYDKLKKHKNIIERLQALAHSGKSLKKKRALLIEKGGGFLSVILPALASAVIGLITNAVSKNFQG